MFGANDFALLFRANELMCCVSAPRILLPSRPLAGRVDRVSAANAGGVGGITLAQCL